MRLDFEDGTHVIQNKIIDTYFVGFNNFLFLRKSCYKCHYVGTERVADLTLADFWGVPDSLISDYQKKFGVSLILANSDKGLELLEKMKTSMEIKEIEDSLAIPYNQALEKPSTDNPYRDEFFSRMDDSNFDKLIARYNKNYYRKYRIKKIMAVIFGSNYQKVISKTKELLRR